jgi:hypothetical protein
MRRAAPEPIEPIEPYELNVEPMSLEAKLRLASWLVALVSIWALIVGVMLLATKPAPHPDPVSTPTTYGAPSGE